MSFLSFAVERGEAGARETPAAKVWSEVRRLGGRATAEPLVRFLLAGAALYALVDLHPWSSDAKQIVVDQARVDRLSADYAAAYGVAPSPAELKALVRRFVDDEIDFREGLAAGLDRDDEVVRRRLIQKAQFLRDDDVLAVAPSDAEVRAWFETHKALYVRPVRVGFSHLFFSVDAGEATALARAQQTLEALQGARAAWTPDRGDRFIDRQDYAGLDAAGLTHLFGREAFAEAVLKAPEGEWAGPFRSAFGWHLVRVKTRTGGDLPSFASVEARARQDLVDDRRARAEDAAKVRLRHAYHLSGDRTGLAAP